MTTEHGSKMEDIPFEVRSYLYELCLGRNSATPLMNMLRRHGLEHEYQVVYSRIRGVMNMTPTCMLQLCRMYEDFTPMQLFGAEYGVALVVERKAGMSGDVVRQVLEANVAMGAVNDELCKALEDKKITKQELAGIARVAATAMKEVSDIIDSAGRAK